MKYLKVECLIFLQSVVVWFFKKTKSMLILDILMHINKLIDKYSPDAEDFSDI